MFYLQKWPKDNTKLLDMAHGESCSSYVDFKTWSHDSMDLLSDGL